MSNAEESNDVGAWLRLKPRTRNDQADEGMAATVADPAWLLARQWQVGEFQGEDAGSPVDVEFETAADHLTRIHTGPMAGGGEGEQYDPSTTPLETLVEREPVDDEGENRNRQTAADGGLLFRRLLGEDFPGIEAFDPIFRLDALGDVDGGDSETQRFDTVVAGRILDGHALFDALAPLLGGTGGVGDQLLTSPDGANEDAYRAAAERFVEWYRSLYDEPAAGESAWEDERLSYSFALGVQQKDGETVFSGSEYAGGHLDWYSVDATEESLGTPPDERTTTPRGGRLLPTRTTFPGAPSSRWFQLEDGTTNLSRVSPTRDSVAGAVFLEFAYRYGHDWFTLPVETPVGSVLNISTLTVRNTFGDITHIGRHGQIADGEVPARKDDDSWRLFETSGATASGILVLPTLTGSLSSPLVEQVEFARDEVANLGWAIEKTVESPLGIPLNRQEAAYSNREDDEATYPGDDPTYRLMTEVPPHWYPMVARPTAAGENRLRRGRFITLGDESIPNPMGRLLADPHYSLYEEEVPRMGVSVERAYQFARWIDGRSVLWVSRSAETGYGQHSSGVAYDTLSER